MMIKQNFKVNLSIIYMNIIYVNTINSHLGCQYKIIRNCPKPKIIVSPWTKL